MNVDVFIDGPQGRPSGGVHLLYEGEAVKKTDTYVLPATAPPSARPNSKSSRSNRSCG
jgi:hypothetical protein